MAHETMAPRDATAPRPSGTSMPDDQQHVTATQARGGVTPHMTRYVLAFGIGLTVVAFAMILLVAG